MVASVQSAAPTSGYNLTKRQALDRLWSQLKQERSTWETQWQELADYFLPHRIRLNVSQRNRGDRRNQKIIDSTPSLAARALSAGLMSGVTNPTRPWKNLTVPDPDLANYGPVKSWLAEVNRRMDAMFLGSNLYLALPNLYRDCGVFGIAAMAALEDQRELMRFTTFNIGSYAVSANERQIVDTFVREIPCTVRNLVNMFARRNEKSGSMDWSNISRTVRSLWDAQNYEAVVTVLHAVYPNQNYQEGKAAPELKQFDSCYFEESCDDKSLLREGGFDQFPILCPRWEANPDETYGTSPGWDVIGDAKALQVMQRRKSLAIEKMINPPMLASASIRNEKASLLPGDITYAARETGAQEAFFKPIHDVNVSTAELRGDIEEHRERIRSAFFQDLFLLFAESDRRQITATEIDARREEKMLMLGPVLERLDDELLDPLVERAFYVMANTPGLLPPPPPEIQGIELRVEYVSIMAQAQKLLNTSSLQRAVNFVASMAQVDPSALDKLNVDGAIDAYADAVSVNPDVIRSSEEAQAIREARQQAQQQQAAMANMQQMADTAKTLSETPVNGQSALDNLAGAAMEA